MSYARFGADDSDVYVFESTGGALECCGCIMLAESYRTADVEQFIGHLTEHITAGHHVPPHVIPMLREHFPDGQVPPDESTGESVPSPDPNPKRRKLPQPDDEQDDTTGDEWGGTPTDLADTRPTATLDDRPIVVSAFAGIGGFDLGFERAGFQTGAVIEWDAAASRVLAHRFPNAARFSDVKETDGHAIRHALGGRPVTILTGGFPCQDLSVAGRRAGLGGKRSGLYGELLRLATELTPEWLVVENVPGLLSSRAGEDFTTFLGDVTGFYPAVPDGGWRNSGVCHGERATAVWRVLDARHFGVAQRRRRVFVVVHAGDGAAPVEVLAELEGMRRHPAARVPSWQGPPRPLVGTAVARGAGTPDRAGAGEVPAADPLGVDTAATLQGGGDRGWRVDAEGAAGGHIVPLRTNVEGEVANTLLAGSASDPWDTTMTTYVGELQQEGTTPGDIANTLVARDGKGVNGAMDTTLVVGTYPVAVRGRDGGAQAELGEHEVANTLRTPGGGSSHQHILSVTDEQRAYVVDKERGLPNSEGIKVTETEVAPTIVAEEAERTDRGLRIVQPPYTPETAATLTAGSHNPGVSAPGRRHEDDTNLVVAHETGQGWWKDDDVAGTLRAEGENRPSRPSHVVIQPTDEERFPSGMPMSARIEMSETLPPLMAQSGPNRGGSEGPMILDRRPEATQPALAIRNDQTDGIVGHDIAPTLTGGNGKMNVLPPGAIPIQDGRGLDKAQNGLGVGSPDDPSYTLDTTGAQAVATYRKSRRASTNTDDETWVEADHANTLNTFDVGDTRSTEVVVERIGVDTFNQSITGDVALTLRSGHRHHEMPTVIEPTALHITQDPISGPVSPALTQGNAQGCGTIGVGTHRAAVRRLTPRECERLQGFPDDHTLVPDKKGKPAADGARYKQLGNAVCCNVAEWLACRIHDHMDGTLYE